MRGVNLAVFGALLLAGCGGGTAPVVPTYPLDGTFRQVKIGSVSCPGTANDSFNSPESCGSDYRITFSAAGGSYRYYDASTDTTLYQGTYFVDGTTLSMTVRESAAGGSRVVRQTLRFTEPTLTIIDRDSDSSQIDIEFQRL